MLLSAAWPQSDPVLAQPGNERNAEEAADGDPPDDAGADEEPEPARFRRAVPERDTLEQARRAMGEVYREQYQAARNDRQKWDLVRRMLEDAEADDEPAERFAKLRIAGEIAAGSGDLEGAVLALDRLGEEFAVDRVALFAETFGKLRDPLRIPPEPEPFLARLEQWYQAAWHNDRYEEAAVFNDLADTLTRRLRHFELRRSSTARRQQLQQLSEAFEEVRPARAALESNPTDEQANAAVGRFLCFVKEDWENGLPMLALGDDPALRELARRELLLAEEDSAAVVRLADAWWQAAEEQGEEAPPQAAMFRRAADWYLQALPELSGQEQAKAQQRVEAVGRGR